MSVRRCSSRDRKIKIPLQYQQYQTNVALELTSQKISKTMWQHSGNTTKNCITGRQRQEMAKKETLPQVKIERRRKMGRERTTREGAPERSTNKGMINNQHSANNKDGAKKMGTEGRH